MDNGILEMGQVENAENAEILQCLDALAIEESQATPHPAQAIPAKKTRKKIVITEEPDIVLLNEPTMPIEPRLPVGRVKHFMKLDQEEGKNISADALYLMTKATVQFLCYLFYLVQKK
jgi:ABC-type histidine transport system ATPase subunit